MKKKFKPNSISNIIFKYALLFIVPIIILLVLSNLRSIKLLRSNAYTSNKNTIYLYMNQIDSIFSEVETELSNNAVSNAYLQGIGKHLNSTDSVLASYRLEEDLEEIASKYHIINGIFAYSSIAEKYIDAMNFNYRYSDDTDIYEQRNSIKNRIIDKISHISENEIYFFKSWFTEKIGNNFYIIRIFKNGSSYIGTWVKADDIVKNLTTINISGLDHIILVGKNGIPLTGNIDLQSEGINLNNEYDDYYLTGVGDKYLVVGQKSTMGDINLVALIQDNNIIEGLHLLNGSVAAWVILSIILLLMFINFAHKKIVAPVQKLSNAMRSIEDGDFSVKIEDDNNTVEFSLLNNTFNSMTAQIEDLKINIYEEKLQRQKAQMHFYQIQINPHFFINTLNTVYGFAQIGDCEMVQKMILCIVKHFRYTLQNATTVELNNEIEFIENFISMRSLNSPGISKEKILFDIDKNTIHAEVPILLIQTFVDNSIKHNKSNDKQIYITVKTSIKGFDSQKELIVKISDTGRGFDGNVMESLNNGLRVDNSTGGKHIGIYNVQQRLLLLYGEESSIKFRNNESGGATVDVIIPFSQKHSGGSIP